jgi:hypothetical protein
MIAKTFIMPKEIRAIRVKSLRANKIFRDHGPNRPGRSERCRELRGGSDDGDGSDGSDRSDGQP